jgi:catechol 2,3-dioxygenase-like lactoylglutathione lyase family enzyme
MERRGDHVSAQPVTLLGELALRVNDLPSMVAFYRDVVGLEVWYEYPDCGFFRIADGVEGHPPRRPGHPLSRGR